MLITTRWSAIASRLPRRTDNEIKNYWNTHLKKRLMQVPGIGPFTSNNLELLTSPSVPTRLTHMTQWDLTLAEAQARLKPSSSAMRHPSAFFMSRSWKTKVGTNLEETLKPKFGTVKLESQKVIQPLQKTDRFPSLEKYPAVQSVLRPDTVLGAASSRCMGAVSMGEHSGASIFSGSVSDPLQNQISPTSILRGPDSVTMAVLRPDTVLGAASSRCMGTLSMGEENSGETRSSIFSGSVLDPLQSQISRTSILHGPDSLSMAVLRPDTVFGAASSRCMGTVSIGENNSRSSIFSGSVLDPLQRQISPKSTLHGPDSDLTYADAHSPCGSTNSGNSDCFDLILHQSSSYQKFPVIPDQEPRTPDTFWQRQQAAMMEALQPADSEIGLESITPLDFDEAEFPQF